MWVCGCLCFARQDACATENPFSAAAGRVNVPGAGGPTPQKVFGGGKFGKYLPLRCQKINVAGVSTGESRQVICIEQVAAIAPHVALGSVKRRLGLVPLAKRLSNGGKSCGFRNLHQALRRGAKIDVADGPIFTRPGNHNPWVIGCAFDRPVAIHPRAPNSPGEKAERRQTG